MKKSLVLSLCLLCALALCACGDTAASQDNTAYVGNYVCTGITMDGLAMNPEGKWLELHADGTATTFLTAASNEAEWQLSGEAFTMTIAGKTVATGTLQSNQLTLEMSGMEYTFAREGTQPQEGDSDSGTYATFTCYGGLYSVRYASDVFQPDPAGLSDLYTDDGTKGWITKLDSAERVTEWLASFDAKGTSETVTDYQTMDLTVAGYSARAIVYQDETGWDSEVLVNFGKDLGNDTYPMYAAYLYFTGPTYLSVWSEDVQAIVNSLTLPQ